MKRNSVIVALHRWRGCGKIEVFGSLRLLCQKYDMNYSTYSKYELPFEIQRVGKRGTMYITRKKIIR